MLSKQTHFIWSRTELLGRCDIAVGTVYVNAGTGVGTRSSSVPSVRMVSQVGSHTHLTHLALKTEEKEDVDETDNHNSIMAGYSLFTTVIICTRQQVLNKFPSLNVFHKTGHNHALYKYI